MNYSKNTTEEVNNMSQNNEPDESEQFAWAVWLKDGHTNECVSVLASDEQTAKQFAQEESDVEPETINVDGPYQDTEPAYYEFEYTTEHRERVIVEAPYEDYAKELADSERTYHGEYIQTVRTETRRQDKDLTHYDESDGPNYELEKKQCHSLTDF